MSCQLWEKCFYMKNSTALYGYPTRRYECICMSATKWWTFFRSSCMYFTWLVNVANFWIVLGTYMKYLTCFEKDIWQLFKRVISWLVKGQAAMNWRYRTWIPADQTSNRTLKCLPLTTTALPSTTWVKTISWDLQLLPEFSAEQHTFQVPKVSTKWDFDWPLSDEKKVLPELQRPE